VFAGGKLRHNSTVGRMGGNLRGDYVGEGLSATTHDGRGGLVAGAFDA